MSMLSKQVGELRMLAGDGSMEFVAGPIRATVLREAADTIERLRKQVAECQIAELKADYDTSRYSELFGTPERAAQTLIAVHGECETSKSCYPDCPFGAAPTCPRDCWSDDYDALLGWLRGGNE